MNFFDFPVLSSVTVIETPAFKKDNSWQREINQFLKVINKSKKSKYRGDFNDAYETMRVIDLIYQSKL